MIFAVKFAELALAFLVKLAQAIIIQLFDAPVPRLSQAYGPLAEVLAIMSVLVTSDGHRVYRPDTEGLTLTQLIGGGYSTHLSTRRLALLLSDEFGAEATVIAAIGHQKL